MRKERLGRRMLNRLRSMRVRAALSLGVILCLGATGTWAYWSDTATVAGGAFTAGTVNLKVNSVEGNPTAYAWTAFALANMVPGESVAASIPIQNVGSVPLTYTATATGSGGLLPYLTFTTYVGGTATNNLVGGLRAGTCTGTASAPLALTGAAQAVIGTAQMLVATTGTQDVCVLASLATTAASAAQGQSALATYVFNAKQIGAP